MLEIYYYFKIKLTIIDQLVARQARHLEVRGSNPGSGSDFLLNLKNLLANYFNALIINATEMRLWLLIIKFWTIQFFTENMTYFLKLVFRLIRTEMKKTYGHMDTFWRSLIQRIQKMYQLLMVWLKRNCTWVRKSMNEMIKSVNNYDSLINKMFVVIYFREEGNQLSSANKEPSRRILFCDGFASTWLVY